MHDKYIILIVITRKEIRFPGAFVSDFGGAEPQSDRAAAVKRKECTRFALSSVRRKCINFLIA